MRELTAQELFNESVTKVIGQGRACYTTHEDGSQSCKYEADGLGCAVGVLRGPEADTLTLSEITPNIEAMKGEDNEEELILALCKALDTDIRPHLWLCIRLQEAHDKSVFSAANDPAFIRSFKEHVERIALNYCLTLPECVK